jgi:plastocyanin
MQRLAAPLLAIVLLAAGVAAAVGATRTVRIENDGFRPATVTVTIGDTVVWRNTDNVRHQVVADNGSFASPSLAPGTSYSFSFPQSGRFRYRDALEPNERGTVVVRDPPAAVALAASPTLVVFGAEVKLSGTVSNRRQGQQVEVWAQTHGGQPTRLATVETAAGGVFEFVDRPQILTGYQVRWRNVSSQPTSVQVRPRITLQRARIRYVARVNAGRSFARRWVYLQRRTRFYQWVNVRKLTLGPRSGRFFRIRKSGRYRIFMTVNQAGAGYLASWSESRLFRRSR